MGFGFNLFFIFILVPLTGFLLITWLLTRQRVYGFILGFIWMGVVALAMLSSIFQAVTSKKILKKKDYYGQYIINRKLYPGSQADWQYNSFRFEIKDNDSIYFYITDKEKLLKTYRGVIATTKPYSSERLIINMAQPTHHIVATNPTTYRSSRGFYLVFHSPRFNNVFFKKGKWKHIRRNGNL